MLSLITVRNYAVIDEVDVEFQPGMSVLTGETGAGKSILVDALGLALGDRADAGAVRKGCREARISVLFECPQGHPALNWLTERGLDHDRTCVLRRIVSAKGRSRAFVNNQPATLQDLRSVGSRLVNIHGQGAHQALMQAQAQRGIVDHHGNHLELARQVAAAFGAWRSCQEEYEAQRQRGADRASEVELLRFQVRELENLDYQDGELDTLQEERSRLANVDRLAGSVESALSGLFERDHGSAQELIAQAQRELSDARNLDPFLGDAADLLSEAEIQVQEAVRGLASYRDRLEPDPSAWIGWSRGWQRYAASPCVTASKRPNSEPCSQRFARELPHMETPRNPWRRHGSGSGKPGTPTSRRRRISVWRASRALRPWASRLERRWPFSDFQRDDFARTFAGSRTTGLTPPASIGSSSRFR